jgi:hypothetical protein
MKKVLVTFGGKAYDPSIAMTIQNQSIAKVDEIRVYDDAWLLQSPFYAGNKWIFEREPKNHLGHCSWKPYIIRDAMLGLQPGDVVLYVDGDTHPIADLSPLFEMADREGIVLFEATGVDNMRFTKAECFGRILGKAPFPSQHACGRFQLFKVGNALAAQILMNWQAYNLDPLCQFDEGSTTMQDQPEFFRNSAEQSVLSMLALRYKIPLHREACQYGWPAHPGIGQPGDTYPQLFHQEWATGDRNDVSGSRFRNV